MREEDGLVIRRVAEQGIVGQRFVQRACGALSRSMFEETNDAPLVETPTWKDAPGGRPSMARTPPFEKGPVKLPSPCWSGTSYTSWPPSGPGSSSPALLVAFEMKTRGGGEEAEQRATVTLSRD